MSLLENEEFRKLEKEYPFLSRAREKMSDHPIELCSMPCVVLDIETTGLEPARHEIIEIGALNIRNNQIIDVYNQLIKPGLPISSEIEKLTGISQEMVEEYPSFQDVIPDFLSFIGKKPLIAHNSDFDIIFLKHHINKLTAMNIENPVFCTLKLSRVLLPNLHSHRLASVADYFKVENPLHHRAIPDAETTFLIWQKMVEKLKEKKVVTPHQLEIFLKG